MTTVRLVSIYAVPNSYQTLYDLLKERTKVMSIGHQQMPTMQEHIKFVVGHPYEAWYLIQATCLSPVGAIYLTKQREVGVFIFREHHHNGYASAALALLRSAHPGRMLANLNPANEPSIAFFRKHGGKLIQTTYELPKQPREEKTHESTNKAMAFHPPTV